jgi:hypothetical protein
MEWIEIVDGKLKHHIHLSDVCGDKPLHLVAQGEAHYGHWLMTEEEIKIAKKEEESLDSIDEWNKFAYSGLSRSEKAYNKGREDKEANLSKNLEYNSSAHKGLNERTQKYYNAGYDGIEKDKVNVTINEYPAVVYQYPWMPNDTILYYENHPFAALVPYVAPLPYMTWKKAIEERGSEEKMKEFVEYYNNLKGEKHERKN